LDAALGQTAAGVHDKLLAMVHGTLPSPSFVSATAKTHGAWERDETGQLRVKRSDDVPFTLFVPAAVSGAAPIVLYQHQLGRERSDAIPLANVLAARGIAVLAIDAPFQGLRAKSDSSKGVDSVNRFTGDPTPDRFGDEPGDFYGAMDNQGTLMPLHPFYVRDAVRQGVVDLMTTLRFVEQGDFGSITALDAALKSRKFGATRFGLVGEDVGATLGMLLSAFEPNLQALVLFAPSAFITQEWWRSPADAALFAQLAQRLGRDSTQVDYVADAPDFWPGLSVFETLLGRAEPVAYAPALRRLTVNALLLTASDDEAVSNLSSEAAAVALGATDVSGAAHYVGDLTSQPASAGDMITGNFAIEDDHVTRVFQSFSPADHALLRSSGGAQSYTSPVDPPFVALNADKAISNPNAATLAEIANYFNSFFACVTAVNPSSSIKCAAAVTIPGN
jgi:dienelactone hydrolase